MKVGFCGIGLMGLPMAQRLLAAGHEVRVWNRSVAKVQSLAQASALVCASPAELASTSEAVCLCLLNVAAVEQVVFGKDGLAEGRGARWLIDHSSIPPQATRSFAERLHEENGMQWIDAPVSGGVPGAKAGTLAIMAGGDIAAIDEVRAVLGAYAARVTRMGDVGAGQTAKLCNQTIVMAALSAIAEAVSLAKQSGLDATLLTEALAGGWADSKVLQIFVPRMVSPPGDVIGTLNTAAKDIDTVMALAQQTGTAMPVAAAVQQMLRMAQVQGLGEADMGRVIDVLARPS